MFFDIGNARVDHVFLYHKILQFLTTGIILEYVK